MGVVLSELTSPSLVRPLHDPKGAEASLAFSHLRSHLLRSSLPPSLNLLCPSSAQVRLLNYSKDAGRGVDDFELLADGLLVYKGRMRQSRGASSECDWQVRGGRRRSTPRAHGHVHAHPADACAPECDWQALVLTDEPHVLHAEAERVHFS